MLTFARRVYSSNHPLALGNRECQGEVLGVGADPPEELSNPTGSLDPDHCEITTDQTSLHNDLLMHNTDSVSCKHATIALLIASANST